MPFFDFHCHPVFKHLLSPNSDQLTAWDDLKVKLKIGKLFGRETEIGINSLFNGVFNSQSNLKQMQKGGVNLAGVALYVVENQIAKGILERKIANSGKINLIDPERMKQLEPGNNYYSWTKRTMDAILANKTAPAGSGASAGANFKFINNIGEYNMNDLKTVHGVLILEGLHNFCNDPLSATAEADFDDNFNDFKARYKTRILAVNIPHMQDFPCANHAFGMQFIKEEMFYPKGKGFSNWGKNAIKKMYDNGILIDVKHMSYYTRTQLIAQRGMQGYEDIPIICTHAGLTGCHSNDRYKYLQTRPKLTNNVWRIRYYKPYGTVQNASFNRSSINLYDDEILSILNSGGLIGISMDQRILGYPTENIAYKINEPPYDQEYIDSGEADIFFRGFANPGDVPFYVPQDDVMTGDDVADHEQMGFEYHYYYFLNQVFHILTVAKKNGIPVKKAAACICIGSDFDGLINSLDCCINSEQLAGFKTELRWRIVQRPTFWKTLSIKKEEIDPDELLDGIFFNNAYNFLQKFFM